MILASLMPQPIGRDGIPDSERPWTLGFVLPDDVDVSEAVSLVEAALAPCPHNVIAHELTRVRLMTKAKAETVKDQALLVAAFGDELRKYPRDAVEEVFQSWIENQKFFPSWAELKERLDGKLWRRYKLRELLSAIDTR